MGSVDGNATRSMAGLGSCTVAMDLKFECRWWNLVEEDSLKGGREEFICGSIGPTMNDIIL